MTRYDLARLAERCTVLFTQLREETDIFVVRYRELLVLIASYYEHCSEMNEEQFHKYMELFSIFGVNIRETLGNMLYTYTIHKHRDARENGAVFTCLHMAENTSLLDILNRSYQTYYEGRSLDCSQDSLCLEQALLKQGNYNRPLDVYDAIALLYADVRKDAANYKYVEKFSAIVNEHPEQLHRNKYLQSPYQCGMLYYEIGQYEKVCDYFCELAGRGDYHFLPAALLTRTLCEKLERVVPPETLREPRYPEHSPKHVTAYHQYCRFRQGERDPFQRKEYSLKYVLSQTFNEDQPIWEPAYKELEQLI